MEKLLSFFNLSDEDGLVDSLFLKVFMVLKLWQKGIFENIKERA